jgi:hypothetical protein
MFLKSTVLGLSLFLAFIPAILAVDSEWTIDWWFNENPLCLDHPDASAQDYPSIFNSASGSTGCFNTPSHIETFYLSYTGTQDLNLKICFDLKCQSYHTYGPNVCWSIGSDDALGWRTYQVIYA